MSLNKFIVEKTDLWNCMEQTWLTLFMNTIHQFGGLSAWGQEKVHCYQHVNLGQQVGLNLDK